MRRPLDRQGADVDLYALACLTPRPVRAAATMLLQLHRQGVPAGRLVAETFPVPQGDLDEAVRVIIGPGVTSDPEMESLALPGRAALDRRSRDAMTRAIVASATPERDDRLFPGDIAQFQPGGGINLATARRECSTPWRRPAPDAFPEYDEWLRKQALAPDTGNAPRLLRRAARRGPRPGRARVPPGRARHRRPVPARTTGSRAELGLLSGLAGIGLNLLHLGGRPRAPCTTKAIQLDRI